jgi:hypothetical protein
MSMEEKSQVYLLYLKELRVEIGGSFVEVVAKVGWEPWLYQNWIYQ